MTSADRACASQPRFSQKQASQGSHRSKQAKIFAEQRKSSIEPLSLEESLKKKAGERSELWGFLWGPVSRASFGTSEQGEPKPN